jgi:Flp pilus assembly protein TadD
MASLLEAKQAQKERKFDQAIEIYKQLIQQEPNLLEAYNAFGFMLYQLKRYSDAVIVFKNQLQLHPNYAEGYSNLGASLSKLQQYREAIACYEKALSLKPNYAGAITNMGNAYNKIGEHESAVFFHKRAISIDAKSANHFSNLGTAYKKLGRMHKAKAAYEKAISLDPEHINAHFDLATVYLMLEMYTQGFKAYEWRFKKEEMNDHLLAHRAIYSKPYYKEGSLKNVKLLVHTEQGYGDNIQFARYIPNLQKRGAEIIFYCREGLKELYEESFSHITVIERTTVLPAFDMHLPLLSASHVLDPECKILDNNKAYLKAPKKKLPIGGDKRKFKIALIWGASNTGADYQNKKIDLRGFEPLMNHNKIELYSLQVGSDQTDIAKYGYEENIIDLSAKLINFSKTASALSQMDLVITCDTSVAHLSGSLAKKTWVMLQKVPDWRWRMDSSHSRWYKNMQLFRQYSHNEWSDVYKRIFRKLELEYKIEL